MLGFGRRARQSPGEGPALADAEELFAADPGGQHPRPASKLMRRGPTLALAAALVAAGLAGGWWLAGHLVVAEPEETVAVIVDLATEARHTVAKPAPAVAKPPPEVPVVEAAGEDLVVSAVSLPALAAIHAAAPGPALSRAPDPALTEEGPAGRLPRIAKDGRKPLQVYARPFDARDDRPRVVVIVTGLGLSKAATQAAIERLPGAVTLAFDPYAPDIDQWTPRVRAAGHETLLSLPMQSSRFPFVDPGPLALLATLPAEENLNRVDRLIGRLTGYVGVIDLTGDGLAADRQALQPILEEINKRGLMLVDAAPAAAAARLAQEIGLPVARAELWVDDVPDKAAIDAALERLEEIARRHGVAVGLARAYPLTLRRLAAWAGGLESRSLVLAPVSAAADRQFAAPSARQ